MTEDQEERLVLYFELIVKAIEGLREEAKRAGERYWPSQREQKEVVVSRVESAEDRERKLQGTWRRTAGEAIDPSIDEEPEGFVGERTRKWLRDHPKEVKKTEVPDASSETPVREEEGGTGTAKVEGQA